MTKTIAPRYRVPFVVGLVSALVVLAALVGLYMQSISLESKVKEESRARVVADQNRRALAQDVVALREQVIKEGATPVAPAPTLNPAPAPTPGLSPTEARQIATDVVTRYSIDRSTATKIIDAALSSIRLTPGPKGDKGDPPTAAEVESRTQAAAAAYLSANPPAPGKDGAKGADGATGAKGDTGSPGRGVTSVALDSTGCMLTFSYTDGTTSTAGPICGRGISSTVCGDNDRWTVTYTDGTKEDAGSCRVGLLD